jgi:TonB-dependent receptor
MNQICRWRVSACLSILQVVTGSCFAAAADEDDAESKRGANALEEITVTAQRTTVEQAREAQKVAPNLINIATYEEIRKLPDVSTGEAVRRIPGISLETDEGEGRYVNIRGFDADLNSTTFGGLRLPPTNNASPFGGYRAVTLDSIPIGLVGALTVTKSNLPSQDAEALGGTIEITPKTAPQSGAPFAEGAIGGGYEPLGRTPVYDVSVTAGGRFGGPGSSNSEAYSDKPFSVVLTLAYNENSRHIDDVEPAYFNDGVHPYLAISNIQQRDYELNRKRHGLGIDLGYQPDPDNSYYVRAFDAGYTERYYRQFLNLSPDGNTTLLPNGQLQDTLTSTGNPVTGGSPPPSIEKAFRDEKETSIDRIFMVGGSNVIDGIILDYRAGYTYGSYTKAYDYNSAFDQAPNPNAAITYGNTGRGFTPIYSITGADYLNPNLYAFSSFNNSTANNYDRETSFAPNVEVPLNWGGFDTESIKGGVSIRLRHKRTTANPTSYDSYFNSVTTPLLLSQVASSGNETYYASQYQNGVDIRPGLLQSLLGGGTPNIGDNASSLRQFLDAHEDVYAGYVQYQMSKGPFGLTAGVRVEHTYDLIHVFSVPLDTNSKPLPILDANGNPTNQPQAGLTTATNRYTNAFPSVQGRYAITPTLIGRATWSSTIARPGFNQIGESQTIDLGSGNITQGNPALKPATANSFDVSIEQYLQQAGILQLAIFDKEVKNYIVGNSSGRVFDPTSRIFLSNITFANAGPSYARGFEFNWQKRFTELPGPLSGLGAGANYTYVDSRFEIRPGEHSRLPSTSKETWNASISYDLYGLSLRVAAYSVSSDLFAIGTNKSSDVYNAHRLDMDFGSSYTINNALSLYFNIKRLLNTPHSFYQGTPDRPIQREFYGQDYLFGVRYNFEGKK